MKDNNIVVGYNDYTHCGVNTPCFLPYDFVARGQFAKILVKTFGWTINTTGGPHFTDVPTTDTYYDYIETLYNQGIITGYTGTDCTNYGLTSPCFRTYFHVTRSQMAKMVSNAAGFSDSVAGRSPSYYDVPSSDPFFAYVERLVMHHAVAQYPPALTQPYCGSSTQPCYFPYTDAVRSDSVMYIFSGRFYSSYGQVFAQKGRDYDGADVYLSTPDPTTYAFQWQAGPVGVTDRWNGHYIESGPQKKCDPFCNIHPYGNWNDGYASNTYFWDTSVNLGGNLTYQYKSLYFGGSGGQWQSQFCDGFGCRGMVTSGDIGSSLPFVFAAGETSDSSVHFGTITASYAQARKNGSWSYWCYDPTLAPWSTFNSTIGSCTNSSWTLNY